MAFKLALTAGHYKYTSGKRCDKSLDPNETREWVLNDRICDKIEKKLSAYDGYELLRTDDTTGENAIGLVDRTSAANRFRADFYLSIHHNAGAKLTNAGGIMAFVYPGVGATTKAWQKELYDSLIKYTGLKGNRSNPLAQSDLHEVRETNMPAVLLELGFMDSKTDTPVILTEEYAEKCAKAIVEVIVKKAGLKLKEPVKQPEPPKQDTQDEDEKNPSGDTNAESCIYRVQIGAYSNRDNADRQAEKAKAAGFGVYVKVE